MVAMRVTIMVTVVPFPVATIPVHEDDVVKVER